VDKNTRSRAAVTAAATSKFSSPFFFFLLLLLLKQQRLNTAAAAAAERFLLLLVMAYDRIIISLFFVFLLSVSLFLRNRFCLQQAKRTFCRKSGRNDTNQHPLGKEEIVFL